MANGHAVFVGHQRQGQCARRFECVDQVVLALVAAGMVLEGGCDLLADGVFVSGLLIPDQHVLAPVLVRSTTAGGL